MSIHVQLDRFEGPLGLLLHLIREQEMDIFNINIHHITSQYLEYIKTMRRLDLEVAGEFVAMAATLLHIKSKMLLPQYNEEGEEVSEDPRKELVHKLLEYKKFRELSADLYKRALLGRDVFPRTPVDEIEAAEEGELVLEENPLFSLIASYRTALKNMKKTVHRVASELQSIASRILEIKDRLMVGNRVVFRDLITANEGRAGQVLVTFLSILELAKMGFISVFQNDAFSDIHVETKKIIDRDIVSQVESYDSVNAQATAESIMASARLSLSEPVATFEGEEAPVVVALTSDGASDDEIAAEEALMGPEESQHILTHDTEKSLLPEEVASDDEIEMELARMAAEDRGEVYVPPARPEPVPEAEPLESESPVAELQDGIPTGVSEDSVLEAASLPDANRESASFEPVTPESEPNIESETFEVAELESFNLAPAEPAPNEQAVEATPAEPTPGVAAPAAFSRPDFSLQMLQDLPGDEAAAAFIEDVQHAEPVEIMPEALIEPDVEHVMATIANEDFVALDESSHEIVLDDSLILNEPVQQTVSEPAGAPEPESIAAAPAAEATPEAAATPAPAIENPKLKPQVSSALNAALSAFDAFNDIKPDSDPEVST